jgi:hypothetical protein
VGYKKITAVETVPQKKIQNGVLFVIPHILQWIETECHLTLTANRIHFQNISISRCPGLRILSRSRTRERRESFTATHRIEEGSTLPPAPQGNDALKRRPAHVIRRGVRDGEKGEQREKASENHRCAGKASSMRDHNKIDFASTLF